MPFNNWWAWDINGYAFGDIDQLVPIIERVQREGKTVPDLTKIYPRVTFKPKSEWDAGKTRD